MAREDSGSFLLGEDVEEVDLDTFMTVLRGQITEFRLSATESIEDGEIEAAMTEADWWEHFFLHLEDSDEEE